MSESRAIILGCSGHALSAAERAFFAEARPFGFILFARNVAGYEQLRALTEALRESVGRADAPVLIDQEGGRVQRLRAPLAPDYPPAAALGALHARDPQRARRAVWLMSRLHALDLARAGVTVDCLPVLDVPVAGSHDVIGNRAYGRDPAIVAELGRAAAEGLRAGGLLPVVKHIPGHGRATVDSHHSLPRVDTPLERLRAHDFVPFRALADEVMAMTAHVVYTAVDPERPATASPRVIAEVIRGEIGFDGLLMSDDLSMKALSGSFAQRTRASLAAGCDVVLHCNGLMEEMEEVARAAPMLGGQAARRADAALASATPAEAADEPALRAEFDAMQAAA